MLASRGSILGGLLTAIIVILVLAGVGYFFMSFAGGGSKENATGGGGMEGNLTPAEVPVEEYVQPAPLLMVTFNNAQAAIQGQPFLRQLPARGGKPPYSWTLVAGSLPTGLELTTGGRIVGTPTGNGTFKYLLKLTDANGAWVTNEFTQHVAPGTSPNVSGDYQLPMGGATDYDYFGSWIGGYGWSAPTGASHSTFNFMLGSSTAMIRGVELDSELRFKTTEGIAYMPFAQGGALPWTFTVAGLPDGINYDSDTGLIYGYLDYDLNTPIWTTLKDGAGKEAIGSPASGTIRLYTPPKPSTGGGGTGGGGGGTTRQYCNTGYCYSFLEGICCPRSAQYACRGRCYATSADAGSQGCQDFKTTCY